MADYKNIPLGLRTQTQIPLDVKEYIQNESLLSNLGVNGQLAYTYTKGLVVYCIKESTRWEWREVESGLEDTGLINQDFIYSDNHITFGIDYSNKRYNFFPYGQSTFTVPDATTTIKGILKLANDLGGTADLPTTPTALHKTTNENFTGIKSSTNSTSSITNGFVLTGTATSAAGSPLILNSTGVGFGMLSTNTGTGVGITSTNSSTGYGIVVENQVGGIGEYINNHLGGTGFKVLNQSYGVGVQIDNMLSGRGIAVTNATTGVAILANASIAGTGLNYVGQNNGVDTYTVDKLGNIIANKYTKTGGTAQQILIANGTVRELNPQKEITANYILTNADDGYVIFINNGTTPVSITINTTVTLPNFSVGFIQEGSADVTFIGAGITLTNPIGLKSKGQGYQTFIEKKLSTSTYYLLGNTKV